MTALLFARLGFLDLFSKSENIFLSDLAEKKTSNLLCDGIRQSKDHQAEDESHASKDPRNDVDLLLQLLLLFCLKSVTIVSTSMRLKAPTCSPTAHTTKAVNKRHEAKGFMFFLSDGVFIYSTLCNF